MLPGHLSAHGIAIKKGARLLFGYSLEFWKAKMLGHHERGASDGGSQLDATATCHGSEAGRRLRQPFLWPLAAEAGGQRGMGS